MIEKKKKFGLFYDLTKAFKGYFAYKKLTFLLILNYKI
tara:strand:- start:121 stop:234 length:114 start_codon:yes stop_codon:yes gene_type:complete